MGLDCPDVEREPIDQVSRQRRHDQERDDDGDGRLGVSQSWSS